jgi:hypothetical protein
MVNIEKAPFTLIVVKAWRVVSIGDVFLGFVCPGGNRNLENRNKDEKQKAHSGSLTKNQRRC